MRAFGAGHNVLRYYEELWRFIERWKWARERGRDDERKAFQSD